MHNPAAPRRGVTSLGGGGKGVAPRTCGCHGDSKRNPELQISSREVGSVNRMYSYSRTHS